MSDKFYIAIGILFLLFMLFLAKADAMTVVDCGTSDVPGAVTFTFEDGSQQVRPSILPTHISSEVTFVNHDSIETTPCTGPVAEPILRRQNIGDPWQSIISKTYDIGDNCICGKFNNWTGECREWLCGEPILVPETYCICEDFDKVNLLCKKWKGDRICP